MVLELYSFCMDIAHIGITQVKFIAISFSLKVANSLVWMPIASKIVMHVLVCRAIFPCSFIFTAFPVLHTFAIEMLTVDSIGLVFG